MTWSLLWAVLRLPQALLEAVLVLPELQDTLLFVGEVDGIRNWLHHGDAEDHRDDRQTSDQVSLFNQIRFCSHGQWVLASTLIPDENLIHAL